MKVRGVCDPDRIEPRSVRSPGNGAGAFCCPDHGNAFMEIALAARIRIRIIRDMKDFIEGEPPKDGRWYVCVWEDQSQSIVSYQDDCWIDADVGRPCNKPIAHIPEPIPEYKPRPEWLPEGWRVESGRLFEYVGEHWVIVAYVTGNGLVSVADVASTSSRLEVIAAFARHMEGGGE